MMRVPNRYRQIEKAQFLRLSCETGNMSNLYGEIKYYQVGKVVKIPVFNAICEKGTKPTDDAACMAAAGHPFPWPSGIDRLSGKKGNSTMFHVATFDSFYVSCVRGKKSEYCPGFALAQKTNPTIPDNSPSVEGYFLSNYDNPLDLNVECSVNLGNCQVSLIK